MPLTQLQKARLVIDRYHVGQVLAKSASELASVVKREPSDPKAIHHFCRSLTEGVTTMLELTREIES